MVKKADAERAIRHVCYLWATEKGYSLGSQSSKEFHLSFGEFRSWADAKGYGHYFDFRSVRGARADAEDWFDEEFGQTWRN